MKSFEDRPNPPPCIPSGRFSFRPMRAQLAATAAAAIATAGFGSAAQPNPEEMLRSFYTEALVHGQAYGHLSELVSRFPGRLSGSDNLDGAVDWASALLGAMRLDRVIRQPVMVPHWKRGAAESVSIAFESGDEPLSATALGGSGATPAGGIIAEVVRVRSLDELDILGGGVAGKIVFFDGAMDPGIVNSGAAYGMAGLQRNRGPAKAAAYGAVAALVRSLTFARDDVPHTGVTVFVPGHPVIPAAALSMLAADRLDTALAAQPRVRVRIAIHAETLPPAPSANVIGEIRGSEFPDQILLVGGHLDSWDIAPGAQDDGAGVVESIEVLRLFQALNIKPRHTLRCVLFVNEENGSAGANAYAAAARAGVERHLVAVETDNGGNGAHGFTLDNLRHDAAARAQRWIPLFAPYGVSYFDAGTPGADVAPLAPLGVTVGELRPDSQRYFDYHHTRTDSLDKVNPRELEMGAAALASLLWLVDAEGI
jgi:hypothetical protein